MAYPLNVKTRLVSFGGAATVEAGIPLHIRISTESSRSLIWVENGYRLESLAALYMSATDGQEIIFEIPTTDQNGWLDAATRQAIIVEPGEASHLYTTKLEIFTEDHELIRTYEIGPYAVPEGSGTLDADLLNPNYDPVEGTLTVYIPGPPSDVQPEEVISAAEARAEQAINDMNIPGQISAEIAGAVSAADLPGLVDDAIDEANIPGQVASHTEQQVPPLVALAIADDPTVASAAASAAATALGNTSVMLADLIPDGSNSWWSWPDAVVHPQSKRRMVSMGTRGGALKIGWFDNYSPTVGERVLSTNYRPDDHYTRAIIAQSDRPVVVAGSFHGDESVMRVDRSETPGELVAMKPEVQVPAGGVTSYGTLIQHAADLDTMLAAYRLGGGGDGQTYVVRTTNGGASFDSPMRLANRPYFLFRRGSANTTGHGLLIVHPTSGTVQCHYFRVPLGAGTPVTSGGVDVRNAAHAGSTLWDFEGDLSTPFIDVGKCDLVRQASAPESQRVLDMFGSGRRILVCVYPDKSDMSAGGEYRVLSRQGSDSINSWSEEPLIASGPSFFPSSGYVGGACFASDGSVILARALTSGAHQLERWTRTGGTWTPGTWSLAEILYTSPVGVTLARPRSFVNCDDWSLEPGTVTVGEYPFVDPGNFRNVYGNQRLIRY